MERYFYGPAAMEHEYSFNNRDDETEWGVASVDGYAVWDRKLGHRDDLRICWTVDSDHALKIVDALNKADAS